MKQGKALIIAVNKWDGIESDQRNLIKDQIERKIEFFYRHRSFITYPHYMVLVLVTFFLSINKLADMMKVERSTSEITEILVKAVESHQPPLIRGRRIKLRYAHIGGVNPIRIIIHGNQTDSVPNDYTRYLANYFPNVVCSWKVYRY